MKDSPKVVSTLYTAVAVLGAFLLLGGFGYYHLHAKTKELQIQKVNYENQIKTLQDEITESRTENNFLSETLAAEQNKNKMFEEQIEEIAGTVGILEKLSKTDKELLQKYSKVYFLSEHYIPSKIIQIDQKYVYNPKDQWIHTSVWPFLKKMFVEAADDDVPLMIISAYRSFDEQAEVKEGHVVTYGAGTANQFSAEQGYSEHQLGTTIDLTTPTLGNNFGAFKNTEQYTWMKENAYKFGFIISYPEGNAYYQFEPWHWRFVGVKLAKELHSEGKYFYDFEQREIDKYLVNIFDK